MTEFGISSCRYLTRDVTLALGWGEGIEIPGSENVTILETEDFLGLHKQREMDMNFGTWHMRSLKGKGH
jgi:hypothetical protein